MNLAKPIRRRDPAYLKWIRTLPCTVPRCPLTHKAIEAHHVRADGHGGIGTKPDDSRVVPCCSAHHMVYHDFGRRYFENYYSIELETEIKRLNALYLREHPQAKSERKPRETVAVHLKHCAKCFQVVKLCKAKRKEIR